jgi:predicted dehydrogenase
VSYQRDSSRRLAVGVVGLGGHSYRNILPMLHYLPVRLAALCDVDGDILLRTAREYPGVPTFTEAAELISAGEVEALLLCMGPQQHVEIGEAGLREGLHVWMEKPPALSAADVRSLVGARGDRVCGVGFKKAHMPAARKAKEILADPAFGTLRSMLGIYPTTVPADGAEALAQRRRTDLLEYGCHPLSLMLELGGPVQELVTLRARDTEAGATIFLRFSSGATGTLHGATGVVVERYELFGDKRALVIDDSARITYRRGIPFDYKRQLDFTAPGLDGGSISWEAQHGLATLENKALFVQGFFHELHHFVSSALEGRPVETGSLEFALHLMEVYEAALTSVGDVVHLDCAAATARGT